MILSLERQGLDLSFQVSQLMQHIRPSVPSSVAAHPSPSAAPVASAPFSAPFASTPGQPIPSPLSLPPLPVSSAPAPIPSPTGSSHFTPSSLSSFPSYARPVFLPSSVPAPSPPAAPLYALFDAPPRAPPSFLTLRSLPRPTSGGLLFRLSFPAPFREPRGGGSISSEDADSVSTYNEGPSAVSADAPSYETHINFVECKASDRKQFNSSVWPEIPMKIKVLSRRMHTRKKSLSTRGTTICWTLRMEESKPGSFDRWQIMFVPGGEYIFESFHNNLVILGQCGLSPVYCFSFDLDQATAWAQQGLNMPLSRTARVSPAYITPYLYRGPRVGGFLHPIFYGVPGNHSQGNCASSGGAIYVPGNVFDDDGGIMINSYAGAYFRGRSGQFGAIRSQGVCRKFDTIGQARRHLHECPPVSAPQPAIVPYLAHQLMGFDVFTAADKQGVLPDLMTGDDNLPYGRTTPMLYPYLGDKHTNIPWDPFAMDTLGSEPEDLDDAAAAPAAPDGTGMHTVPEDEASTATAPTAMSSVTDKTLSMKDEFTLRNYRMKNIAASVTAIPLDPLRVAPWLVNIKWVLGGDLWQHDGVHACDILVTTPHTKFLSEDLLNILKLSVSKHPTETAQLNWPSQWRRPHHPWFGLRTLPTAGQDPLEPQTRQ
jgi:hypothetical protein